MTERADAARNRRALLDAAGRLFDADPQNVTMDDVARAAGVGKGTLFRRFGDRTGLLRAVYEARLTDLRAAIDGGPPPLGPGASVRDRIPAILIALVDFKLDNLRLAMALEQDQSDAGAALYTSPSYTSMHRLLTQLVAEDIGPDHSEYLAYSLLAITRIDLVHHIVTTDHVSRENLHAHLRSLVGRVVS